MLIFKKSFEGDIEKAHVAGDTKVVNGKTLVYTEYAPNKFDWRVVEKKRGESKDKSKKNKNDIKIDKELRKKIDYQFHIYQVKLDKLSDDDTKWEAKMINAEKFFVAAVGEMVNDKKIDKKIYEKIRSENDNDFITPTFDDLMKKYKKLNSVEREVHRQSW